MISPAQVPSTGSPERTSSRSGSARPSRSTPSVIVVDSPPGITSPSRPSRSAGTRTRRALRADLVERLRMRIEPALESEHADHG